MPVFDGSPIDLQDLDRTVGETAGTMLYAAGSEDMPAARLLPVTQAGLAVDSRSVNTLLVAINQRLRMIRDGL